MENPCADIFVSVKKTDTLLKPVNSGEELCVPGHSWGPGVRTSYIIHYVISGKGVFYCGQNKFTLKKGQIFVIFPNTIIKYQADRKDPWHYVWVVFNGDEAKAVFDHVGISLKNPVAAVSDGARLTEILRAMPRVRGAVMHENLRFSSLLYEAMSVIVDEDESEKSENIYLTTAVRYIKAHYYEDITVEQISSHVGISRKYLFSVFKNSLGVSPKDYIVDYRMKKACQLFNDRQLSVGNVAYSVGYKDPLTFSRMFKKKLGLSPTDYRNNL
ncbi:MAG: AraC family transcriptional regulator [Clostridia bacterium]|nr:AraC family transcriptional regulator [Clostridia bacterium]